MFDGIKPNLSVQKVKQVKYQGKKGQGLTEFALILPILLLVILGIIEAAWIIWAYITVQNAAREAARYAVTGAPLDAQGNPWTALNDERVEAIKQVAREAAQGLPINDYADLDEGEYTGIQYYHTPRVLGILVRGQDSPDNLEGTVNHPGLKGLNVMVEVYYNVNMLDPLYSVLMGGHAIHLTGRVVLQNEGVNLALGGEVPSFAPPGGDTVAGGSAELDEVLEVWLDGTPQLNIPAGSDVNLLLNRHGGSKSYYVCFDGVAVPQSPVTTNASGTAWILEYTISLATPLGAHTFVSSLYPDCSNPAASVTINVLPPTGPAVGIRDIPHNPHVWPDNSLVQVFVSAHDPDTAYQIYFDGAPMSDGYGGNCTITTDATKSGLKTCAIPDGKLAGTYVMTTAYAASNVGVINAFLEVREGYDLTDKSTIHIILDEHAPQHVYRVYFESGEIPDSQPSGVTTNSDGAKEVAFFIPAGANGTLTLQTQDADSPLPPSTVRQIASLPITVTIPTGPMIVAPRQAPAGEVILIDLRNHTPGATYQVKFDQFIAGTEQTDADGDVIQRIYYRIPSNMQGTTTITSFLQGTTSYSATHQIEVLASPYIVIEGGDTHVLGETITIHLKNHQARTAYDVYLDLDGDAGNGAETCIATGVVTDENGNYTFTYPIPKDITLPDSNPHLMESRRGGNQVAFTNLNVIIADLQITAITPPTNPRPSVDLPVAVSVTNNRAVTITGFPFDNDFYVNRTPSYSNSLPPGNEKIWLSTIGPNETKIITPVVNLYNEGTYTLTAWTDTTNNVVETLENNNILSTTMTLPPCDLTPFVDNFDTGTINTVLKTPPDTMLDQFSSSSFGNNNGTTSWAANWQEIGESDGASKGYVQVTGGELQLRNTTPNRGASRQANLSTAVAPVFSFNYRTLNLDYDDIVAVEVSGNGGSSWTELGRFEDDGSGSRSYDISAYAASNTTIRFRIINSLNGWGEYFYVDNVQIAFSQAIAANWTLTAFGNAAPLPPLASLSPEPEELLAMYIVDPASLKLAGPPSLPVLQATPQAATVAAQTAGASSNAYSVQPAIATHRRAAPEFATISDPTALNLAGPPPLPVLRVTPQPAAVVAGAAGTGSNAYSVQPAIPSRGCAFPESEAVPQAAPLAAGVESNIAEARPGVVVDPATLSFAGPATPPGYQMAVLPASLAITTENEDNITQSPPAAAEVEAAAIPLANDTGWRSPSANAADTGGDGNGFESNAWRAYADGGGYAYNNNGAADRHRYYNYGFSIPTGTTINGIEVRLDWWLDNTSGTNSMSVDLSWNGGSSWTALKADNTETTSEHTTTLGGMSDTWGRTWSASDFSNGNFRVRVTSNSSSTTRDFSLDWIPVRVTYSIGAPPTAPTNLRTEGQTNPGDVTNITPNFSWTFNDPDGDSQSAWEIEVGDDTDWSDAAEKWDSGQVSGSASTVGYDGTALSFNGATYYWRVRTWDTNNNQGPWSATQQFTMHTNQAPSANNPQTGGQTNPVGVTTLTPQFSWTFSDPEPGDSQAAWEIEVNTQSNFAGTVMWDSGKTDGVLPNAQYAGSALSLNGITYYWHVRVWDDNNPQAQGNWSATQQFTMYTNQPPTISSLLTVGQPSPVANVGDPTPDFSWTFNDPDGDGQSAWEIEVGDDTNWNNAEMWDSGQVSGSAFSAVYAGSALTLDGRTYYWRMRVWDDSASPAESAWSATQQFTMSLNQVPTVSSLLTEGQPSPVANVGDPTPDFAWTFNDPDGDGQSAWQIQMGDDSNWNNGVEKWDSGQVSSSAFSAVYSGSALAPSTTYYWRMRVWDDKASPAESAWSATQQFTMQALPALSDPTNLVVTAGVNGGGQPVMGLSWQDNSTDENLFRIERKRHDEASFSVVATIDTSGNPTYTGQRTYTDATVACGGYTYTYRVIAVRDVDGSTAQSNEDSDVTATCPPVTCSSGGESGGILTLCSAGTSIFQNDDHNVGANAGYLFMNRAITSWSFDMFVRLDSTPSMNAASLAGLEVRDSLNGPAKKVELVVRNSAPRQVGAWQRATDNGAVNQVASWTNPGRDVPIWLRIVRANNRFFFYYNTGQEPPVLGTWALLGSTPDAMDQGVYVGLINSPASATASPSTWEQFNLGCLNYTSSTCGVVTENQGLVVVNAINYTDNFKSTTSDDQWAPKSSTVGSYAAMSYTGADYTGAIYTNAPMLEYAVNIKTEGDYYVWLYGYNSGGSSDSVHVGLNGVPSTQSDKIEAGQTGLRWFKNTADNERAYIPGLSQGVHTLNVWGREDGFELIQILLTTDPDYTPDGGGNTPEDQSDCLNPVPPELPPNLTQCNDVLRNTSFEDSTEIHNSLKFIWEVPNTPGEQATSGPAYPLDSGSRSIRLPSGWPAYPQIETERNAPYLYQAFEMPAWLNDDTTGVLTLQKGVTRQAARDSDDRLYFILRDENGVPLTQPMAVAHGAEDPDAGEDGPTAVSEWVRFPNADSYSIVSQDNDIFNYFIGDPQDVAGKTIQAYFYQPNSPGDPNYPASTTFFVDTVQLTICTTQPEPPAQAGTGTIKGLLSVQLPTGPTPVEGVSVWAYKMDGGGGPLLATYTVNAGHGQPNYGFYNLAPGIYQVYAQFEQQGGTLYDFGQSVSVVADSVTTLNLLLEIPSE